MEVRTVREQPEGREGQEEEDGGSSARTGQDYNVAYKRRARVKERSEPDFDFTANHKQVLLCLSRARVECGGRKVRH